MELQQNDRIEEWFLILGDWIRDTSKGWFYALGVVFVATIPVYIATNVIMDQVTLSAVTPLHIAYEAKTKLPLSVTEKKIFDLGGDMYSGYFKIKNDNSEWGTPEQAYTVELKTATGSVVLTYNRKTFVLPSSDKIVIVPRFKSADRPTNLEIVLGETTFVRPPVLPDADFEIQRRASNLLVNQTEVNAVIVNRMPFRISQVDLPVLIYNSQNEVIAAGYTNINDLKPSESRSFQYVWYNRLNNITRIEIVPELNFYSRDIFLIESGQNPFDERE